MFGFLKLLDTAGLRFQLPFASQLEGHNNYCREGSYRVVYFLKEAEILIYLHLQGGGFNSCLGSESLLKIARATDPVID